MSTITFGRFYYHRPSILWQLLVVVIVVVVEGFELIGSRRRIGRLLGLGLQGQRYRNRNERIIIVEYHHTQQ